MHIKKHGPQIRISLYLVFILSMIWCSEPVKTAPEVVMEPAYKQEQIEVQEIPVEEEIVEIEEVIIPRYGFTDDEIYLLTVLLCGSGSKDGDGEYDFDYMFNGGSVYEQTLDSQQIALVLNVVMNRVESDKFPDTVSEVVWAKNQFSYMHNWKHGLPKVSRESYAVVESWCLAYDAYDTSVTTIPPSHLYFSGNGIINKSRARF